MGSSFQKRAGGHTWQENLHWEVSAAGATWPHNSSQHFLLAGTRGLHAARAISSLAGLDAPEAPDLLLLPCEEPQLLNRVLACPWWHIKPLWFFSYKNNFIKVHISIKSNRIRFVPFYLLTLEKEVESSRVHFRFFCVLQRSHNLKFAQDNGNRYVHLMFLQYHRQVGLHHKYQGRESWVRFEIPVLVIEKKLFREKKDTN